MAMTQPTIRKKKRKMRRKSKGLEDGRAEMPRLSQYVRQNCQDMDDS